MPWERDDETNFRSKTTMCKSGGAMLKAQFMAGFRRTQGRRRVAGWLVTKDRFLGPNDPIADGGGTGYGERVRRL